MKSRFTSYHVGVAAEAIAAALFARYGYDVSVQYGANQPEYDLIVSKADKLLRVSVKGTQEFGRGLCQSHISEQNNTYHKAIDAWLSRHNTRTILCFVSFHKVEPLEMPRVYIASPEEVAERLHASKNGGGSTILYENKRWTNRGKGAGSIDAIPKTWCCNDERLEELFLTA